jgi:type I restriction enzyme, S subunit
MRIGFRGAKGDASVGSDPKEDRCGSNDAESTTIGALLARDGGSVKTGPFGTTLKAKEYSNVGVPLISVGEVGYGTLRIRDSTPRAPGEVVERLPEYVLKAGDIVFGRKGAVDRSAMVRVEQAGWFLGSDGIRLRLPNTCDARFISYQLQSLESRSWLLQHATGTTLASLNQSTIERLPIVLPSLPEQRAIAHILGTLDDKIELNRRMNETLEAMARALFKSWFVDFDPVRARAEGRDTGLPQTIAELFPDSFEDSELGTIPKGWIPSNVGKYFSLTMGQSPPGSTYNESADGLPFFQGRTDFGFRFPARRVFCKAPTRLAGVGDTLVSVRAPVGDVNIAIEPCAVGRGVAAVRHYSGSRSFTYHAMHNLGAHFGMFEAEGTVFGSINKADFQRLPFVAAPQHLLDRFESVASPLDDRVESTEHESRALADLRNTLLPMLISGELQLRAADRVVDEAI